MHIKRWQCQWVRKMYFCAHCYLVTFPYLSCDSSFAVFILRLISSVLFPSSIVIGHFIVANINWWSNRLYFLIYFFIFLRFSKSTSAKRINYVEFSIDFVVLFNREFYHLTIATRNQYVSSYFMVIITNDNNTPNYCSINTAASANCRITFLFSLQKIRSIFFFFRFPTIF